MVIIWVTLLFILLSIIELRKLLKTKCKIKHLVTFFVIMILGFIISILQLMKKAPISPSKVIEYIVRKFI